MCYTIHSQILIENLIRGLIMRELTNAERLEVAVLLLDEHQVDEYAHRCSELEQEEIPLDMKPIRTDD